MLIEASEPSIEVVEAVDVDDVRSLPYDEQTRSVVLYSLALSGGAELDRLGRLREALPDLPLMVVSECSELEFVRGVFARGAKAFLPATTPGPVMVAVLKLVIAGGQYAPPSLFLQAEAATRTAAADMSTQELRETLIRKAFPQLTRRQSGVLALVSLGYSNRGIADALDMRENTVKAHVKQIMRKLVVENRTQAALLADRLVA